MFNKGYKYINRKEAVFVLIFPLLHLSFVLCPTSSVTFFTICVTYEYD